MESFGFERREINIKNSDFFKNITKGSVVRLKRTGKGSTAGHRDKIPTKQAKALEEFYESIRKAVSE